MTGTLMLDFYADNARVAIENVKRIFSTPFGIFIHAAITGMIGVVILMFFFSMLLSGSTLAMTLPVILAFNAASCGYGIVDKGGLNYPRLPLAGSVISLLLLLTGYVALMLLVPWESFTGGLRWLIAGVIVVVFFSMGTWIARMNNKQKGTI